MCGFTGFIDYDHSSEHKGRWIGHMLDAIAHRGPDDAGTWLDPDGGVAFGHRRLAIVDLSPAGHQPMHSICGRWIIVFNGEIYNHAMMRTDLEAMGWPQKWQGHSDTEVLLAAISMYGVTVALEKCVGMFAFALWDRKTQTLILARDRLGEKPLYYGWLGKTFLFASDLAAFYRHPHWQHDIDRGALALLMRHGYIPAPYSIFSNISKLQPGCILKLAYQSSDVEIESYWNMAQKTLKIEPFKGTPEQAVHQVAVLLEQSIAHQMMADVPLGAFLSGGIDSSLVVALMQSMSPQPINTFTIGFHDQGYNEATHAKDVAAHLGTNHTELYVTPDEAAKVILQLPSLYSEPFSDSSQIPTFMVSRLARQSVTVSLSGDGGDELFSGYSRYAFFDKIWPYLSRTPDWLCSRLAKTLQTFSAQTWNTMLLPVWKMMPSKYQVKNLGDKIHKLADVLPLRTQEALYRHLVSQWQRPHLLVLNSIEPPTMLTKQEGHPSLENPIRRMMYLDTISYLPDDILTKVDRASMGVGLEVRVPMLDHRLVEFTQSLPMNILRHNNQPKWLLRQLLDRYVPRALIDRPKMGFGVPLDNWLRGSLREWGDALLEKTKLDAQGYFDSNLVRSTWAEHQSGTHNWSYLLWNVLSFQAWLEHTSSNNNNGRCRDIH